MTDQFAEQFKLLQRAKKLEQMGSDDRALELYLEIHNNHKPNTSDSFERPIVILIKKRRYEEALELCNKAIQLIDNDKISGTKDKFLKHIEKINATLATAPIVKDVVKSNYKFGIIGFRSNHLGKKITAITFYILFIIVGILLKSIFGTLSLLGCVYLGTYFVDSIQVKTSKKVKTIIILLLTVSLAVTVISFIQLPEAFNKTLELKTSEDQSSLDGGTDIFTEDDALPEITEANINGAINDVMKHVEVNDALIIVNGSEITFGLLFEPTVKKESAIDIAEEFVNALSHLVANDQNLKKPSSSSHGSLHGELYEFYNIVISGGSGEANVIIKGKKNKNSKFITWID